MVSSSDPVAANSGRGVPMYVFVAVSIAFVSEAVSTKILNRTATIQIN